MFGPLCHSQYLHQKQFPIVPGWGVIDSTPFKVEYPGVTGSVDEAGMYTLMHWAMVRECFCKDLDSKILKMVRALEWVCSERGAGL